MSPGETTTRKDGVPSGADCVRKVHARLAQHSSRVEALVTFGWSAFPREGENALTLYRAADERLYARRVLREPRVHIPHAVGA